MYLTDAIHEISNQRLTLSVVVKSHHIIEALTGRHLSAALCNRCLHSYIRTYWLKKKMKMIKSWLS